MPVPAAHSSPEDDHDSVDDMDDEEELAEKRLKLTQATQALTEQVAALQVGCACSLTAAASLNTSQQEYISFDLSVRHHCRFV